MRLTIVFSGALCYCARAGRTSNVYTGNTERHKTTNTHPSPAGEAHGT